MNSISSKLALAAILPLIFSFQTREALEEPATAYSNITAEQLEQRLANDEKLILLDVRTPSEYTGPLGHIEGSILLPVQELEDRIDELEEYKDREIIAICRSGNRSRVAAEILAQHGFTATNLLGGMKAWNTVMAVQDSLQLRDKN